MAASPVDVIMAEFSREYTGVLAKVRAELLRVLPYLTRWNYQRVLESILRKYNVKAVVTDAIKAKMLQMVAASTTAVLSNVMVEDAVLSGAWSPDAGLFSSKINELARMDEMLGTIKRSLRLRENVGTITQKLFDTGIQRGDVAKVISELSEATRLAAKNAGSIDSYRSLMSDVQQAQRQISRLVNPSTSTLRRAYQNVADAVKTKNEDIVRRAADYAIYFKQKANAERIAVTEFSRAYGHTRIAEMNYDDDVTCVQVVLSSGHYRKDICDFYANANLYGRGKGIYPKDRTPDFPFHPNCRCILDPVYEIEAALASEKDFTASGGSGYLRALSAEDRRKLLGVEGSKEFGENPRGWEKNLRGYQHPKKQALVIKEEAFIT